MMAYRNAAAVLPQHLLEEIQKHVDGAFLYIPRRQEQRRRWGENSPAREEMMRRDAAIVADYLEGERVRSLSERYHLSDKAIYRIIATRK